MSIRTKAILVVCVGFIALVLIVYAVTGSILATGSRQLEAQHGHHSIECLRRILSRQVSDLDTLTAGWASTDDTNQFIGDVNDAYIDTHLVDDGRSVHPVGLSGKPTTDHPLRRSCRIAERSIDDSDTQTFGIVQRRVST